MTLDESIARAPELLSGAAERLMRIVRMMLKHVHLSTEQ